MKIEDVQKGVKVRPIGYPVRGFEQFPVNRSDAPIMVVQEITVHTSWFVGGVQHRSVFQADELEVVNAD